MYIIKKQSNLIKSLLIIFFSLIFFSCTKARYSYICENPEYSNKIYVFIDDDISDEEVDFTLRVTLLDLNHMFNQKIELEAGPRDYIELKARYNRVNQKITHNELLKNLVILFEEENKELKILNSVRSEQLYFYGKEGREKFFDHVKIIKYEQEGLYLRGYIKGIHVSEDEKLLVGAGFSTVISYSSQGVSISSTDKEDKRNSSTAIPGNYKIPKNHNTNIKPNYYELCKKNKEVTENNPVIKKIIWDDVEKFKAEFLKENHLDDKYFNYDCLCYNEGPDYTTAFYTIWDGDAEYTTTVLKTDKAGNIILQDVLFPDEKKSVLGAFTVTSDSYLLLIYDSYTDTTWVNVFKF